MLGVEELDFETERWDIDQLVSYMRELVGVVILYMMRGDGPLRRDAQAEEEAAASRAREAGAGEDAARQSVGVSAGLGRKREEMARRLLEVLEEEGLLQPAEAADTARLHCQIGDRARQWDSGELWLSVAGLARRPSPETVAAFASQWEPGEPPGWDESDSSEGGTPRSGLSRKDEDDALNNLEISTDSAREAGPEHDPGDLDMIGEALLGQPLFSDTLAVVDAVGAEREKSGGAGKGGEGTDWSPWPQLAALENNVRARDTVVPTQGIRKALNVRVLGQAGVGASRDSPGKGGVGKKGGSASAGRLQSTPYVVWVMDVESGAEWRVRRTHAEFAELWEVCTGMRPSLARLDFPSWLPDMEETPGMIEARRPR